MKNMNGAYDAYKKVDVETASQGKLIVMLLNGAIQRAEEGKRAIESGLVPESHAALVRAQDIVGELRASLNMSVGEVAEHLDRSYEYLYHLLVLANINKETKHIDECVEHLIGLRDTWEEVFLQLDAESVEEIPVAPRINPLGNAAINFQG